MFENSNLCLIPHLCIFVVRRVGHVERSSRMFVTHQARLAAPWQLHHLTKKHMSIVSSCCRQYSSQKLLPCSGSHRPPRLEHHDHCRRWQRRRQGWVPMKCRCSPPGWLAAGAPDVGSELKYCFDISVRGSLAITHPLDMSTPRCKEYGHPLRCQIFC